MPEEPKLNPKEEPEPVCRELHQRPQWQGSHAAAPTISAHPSHVSWPPRELHRRPQWRGDEPARLDPATATDAERRPCNETTPKQIDTTRNSTSKAPGTESSHHHDTRTVQRPTCNNRCEDEAEKDHDHTNDGRQRPFQNIPERHCRHFRCILLGVVRFFQHVVSA